MKVLLDECVPKRLGRQFTGHEATTVPQAGWATIKNGKLLRLAEASFDVFLTMDKSIRCQQDTSRLNIAIIVMRARSNRYEDLLPLVPLVLEAINGIRPGEVKIVG